MKHSQIILVFVLIFLMAGCEDENVKPKKYPYITTLPVTNLNSKGVTLEARILDYGQQPITDFGFLLISDYNESRYSLMNITTPEEFSLRMNSDIEDNKEYSVRAYVKTENYEVWGNPVSFTGLGSLSPVIYKFSPDSGKDGTIVTITGNYFSINKDRNYVSIGNQNVEVLAASSTELVIKTPFVNYSGKFKISVTINNQICISEKEYSILGPKVYTVNPEDAEPGEIVTLNGIRLVDDISDTQVFFDEVEAEIISAAENQIVVRVPPYTRYFKTIRLISGIKILDVPYVVSISQKFLQLNTAGFTDKNPPPTFSTNSRGFVFDYDKIWEYKPSSNSWSIVSYYPGLSRYNMFFYTIDNKAYMGGGSSDMFDRNEFWEYDIELNNWKQLADVPVYSGGRGFALNGKGYLLGADLSNGIISFWQYNPENNAWIQIENVIPGNFSDIIGYTSWFILNSKAYIHIKGDRQNFFEFSDVDYSWTQRADCPLEEYGYGFTINNKGYIGSTFWGQVYEYNAEDDRWIEKLPYPGCSGLGYYFGFAINNIGYIGVNESIYRYCPATFYSFTP